MGRTPLLTPVTRCAGVPLLAAVVLEKGRSAPGALPPRGLPWEVEEGEKCLRDEPGVGKPFPILDGLQRLC